MRGPADLRIETCICSCGTCGSACGLSSYKAVKRLLLLSCYVGAAEPLLDLVGRLAAPLDGGGAGEACPPSLLLVGPPGVGKTTLLRDMTGMLANRHAFATSSAYSLLRA